jgi:hypothetical protein
MKTAMSKKETITVQGTEITLFSKAKGDYISLTDIAKYRNVFEPFSIINNWMRSRSTIEFLGLWEQIYNPDFKPTEFGRFRNEVGFQRGRIRSPFYSKREVTRLIF